MPGKVYTLKGRVTDPGEPFLILWIALRLSVLFCPIVKLFTSGIAGSEAAAITGHTFMPHVRRSIVFRAGEMMPRAAFESTRKL